MSDSLMAPVPSVTNAVMAAHTLTPKEIKNLRAKLCLEDEAIDGGLTLARYTEGDKSRAWCRDDLSVNEDALPPALRVSSDAPREFMAPLFEGKWSPESQLGRLTELPHRNGMTGKYVAPMTLRGDPNMCLPAVSLEKIEVVSDELWKAAEVPFSNIVLRRQVKSLLQSYNNGTALSDAQMNALRARLDHTSLKNELVQHLVNSPNNPAYLEVLMLACGEKLRAEHKSTAFPQYIYSFEAQDPHFYHGLQARHNPMRVVCTITEKLGSTMGSMWESEAKAGTLKGKRVLADLCQVVCALADLQAYLGGINNDCTVSSFRLRDEAADSFIYRRWMGKLFAIPTFGRLWKLTNHKHCSLVFNGARLVSLEKQELLENANIPYQRDLITFARSAEPLIKKHVPEGDAHKTTLLNMIKLWTTCAASGDRTNQQALMELESAVCKGVDSAECKRRFFKPLKDDVVCTNAIPALQSSLFSTDFEVTDPVAISKIRESDIYVFSLGSESTEEIESERAE